MPDYRLYCIDGSGKIIHAEWIDAGSEQEALMLARTRKIGLKCELWDRDRLVGTVSVLGHAE